MFNKFYKSLHTDLLYMSTRCCFIYNLNSVASVRKRIIPTERPPLVGEVSANFSW
jgi:hypothetical protein